MHIPIYPHIGYRRGQAGFFSSFYLGNLKHEIVAQMQHVADWGCKMVIPIPTVEVIEPRELAP